MSRFTSTKDELPAHNAYVKIADAHPTTRGYVVARYVALYGHTQWRLATAAEEAQLRADEEEMARKYPPRNK